ncbi:MAG: c-type cytochrome [Phycisphaerae bacterium]
MVKRSVFVRALTGLLPSCMAFAAACSGPQPLDVAINDEDLDKYTYALNEANGDAKLAFARLKALDDNMVLSEVMAREEIVSATRNPFDAYEDPTAVSRGAVIYKIHCARCHGDDARGNGPATLEGYPANDFKTPMARMAATLHRGAPRKWFRVITEGTGDWVDYPDKPSKAMPAFEQDLTREQIWLVITYLQSLDVHTVDQG